MVLMFFFLFMMVLIMWRFMMVMMLLMMMMFKLDVDYHKYCGISDYDEVGLYLRKLDLSVKHSIYDR